jgi:hypothetical protein
LEASAWGLEQEGVLVSESAVDAVEVVESA